MTRTNRIILFSLFLLFRGVSMQAQCLPADFCSQATCVFSSQLLTGNTWNDTGYTGDTPNNFCGTVESNLWFPIQADSSGAISITLISSNCVNGNGMQMAIYGSCTDTLPLACNGGINGGGAIPVTLSLPVTAPGQTYYLMVDGYAGDQCDFRFETAGIAGTNQFGLITGNILIDNNLDCEVDSTDLPAGGIPVTLTGNYTVTYPSNALGKFYLPYSDTGAVTVSLNSLPSNLWTLCASSFTINPDTFPDSTHIDFLLQPLQLCPLMQVDLGLPPFFRACQVARLAIQYCNVGTETAENASMKVIIPNVLDIISTSFPVDSQVGDSLFFDLGNIPPLACNTLMIWVKPPCNNSLFGQTLCVEARVTPDSPCNIPSNWSGAHVDLTADCLGDTLVQFTLKNTGTAPMMNMNEYIIIEDEVVLRSGNFQLAPGESMTVDTPANGATWRLEAMQETNHPGMSMPALSLEGCGGLTPGLVNAFPQNDLDAFVDIECRQVLGSYDPNLKTAVPTGVGPNHLLRPNTPLEYTIAFQNTGTDTAYSVRLVDILPSSLDPNSFRPGAASHPFSWKIFGADTLEVVFNPILLPDSTINEPDSHGWFEFSISPKPDLPDGTLLENRAAIYFDFNAPVITDPAWHTIGHLTVSIDQPEAGNNPPDWEVLGNPGTETCTFISHKPQGDRNRFEVYDQQGRLLRSEFFSGPRFEFQRQTLPAGLYYYRLVSAHGHAASGKIIFGNR